MANRDGIRARVFYLIRSKDVELAEDFYRRCPDVKSVGSLNAFFRRTLTQYPTDTQVMRSHLDDALTIEQWLSMFEQHVLPTLRTLRFPPCTDNTSNPFYQMFNPSVAYG
jgi:hypothetical protein